MSKTASSRSLPPGKQTEAAWHLTSEKVGNEVARKRVAVSLRRGLLRFVEVPSSSDDVPRMLRGRTPAPSS